MNSIGSNEPRTPVQEALKVPVIQVRSRSLIYSSISLVTAYLLSARVSRAHLGWRPARSEDILVFKVMESQRPAGCGKLCSWVTGNYELVHSDGSETAQKSGALVVIKEGRFG